MSDIIMHVNYGETGFGRFGKNSIEDIFKIAVDIGYDGIEFRSSIPQELSHLSYESYIDEIGRCKGKYGLKTIILSARYGDLLSKSNEECDKAIAENIKQVRYANKICGTTIFNAAAKVIKSSIATAPSGSYEFHGSVAASEKDWEDTVKVFKTVAKELENLGIRFAFETHMNTIHDTPQATKKLVDMIGSQAIGVNMDYGNTVYFPNCLGLEETIDLYGDKLFYTHFKNSMAVGKERVPTALSEGEINHRIYLEKLQATGFNGPIGIEAPRPGDRKYYAKMDYEYIKTVIKDLGWIYENNNL